MPSSPAKNTIPDLFICHKGKVDMTYAAGFGTIYISYILLYIPIYYFIIYHIRLPGTENLVLQEK